ncbi:MAG TPA: tRNA pseudouridine(55) synthase TruB [Armatimonadota bacterium]|jgi:tRNA pseudouridine55 synthase
MDGFLIIDKPAGWTSHDVVARVRRLAGQKRVGHTGTLDPDATGVLLVCLGAATRLIEYIDDFHKSYRATMALGVETDSEDASGVITCVRSAADITAAALNAALPAFRGEIEQIPPMVSAVHHDGKRLYELARAGVTVERKPRPVTIYRLAASDFGPGEIARATLCVECSSGTYVRTLCADIGTALGVGGHMETLRRTAVGPFTEADAIPLDSLDNANIGAVIRPAMDLVPGDWPVIECSAELETALRHGRRIPAASEADFAMALADGSLLAVLRRDGDQWQPAKVFPRNDPDAKGGGA